MTFQGLLMCEKGKSLFRAIMEKGILCTIFLSIVLLFAFTSYATETIELPDELKGIQITDEFIKSPNDRVGIISVLKGDGKLIVVREPSNKGFYADENDSVYEHDRLYTLSDCKCRITFFDNDEIVMAANSHLEIKEMQSKLFRGVKRTIFGMSKGKAVFYIKKIFHFRNAKVQLDTPNAVIGVRGTTFGVEVKKTKKGRGRADMLNRMIASTSLQQFAIGPDTTNSIETNVFTKDPVDCHCKPTNQDAALLDNDVASCTSAGLNVTNDPEAVAGFIGGVAGGMDAGPGAAADSGASPAAGAAPSGASCSSH